MKIALAGNPNSGKTTMYNALTGRSEDVGNWAGVTVEKKEHQIKRVYNTIKEEILIVDLPGAYSISPFTQEESVTSTYVKNENPDVIINIVDATNLSRSLFFTTQLLELGIPVVVALNKTDVNEKKHNGIDKDKLSSLLGCNVIETVSTSKRGLKNLIKTAIAVRGKNQTSPYQKAENLNDKKAVELDDRRRFDFVNEIVGQVEFRKTATKDRTKHDKFDSYVTKPYIGIPLFILVIFGVFWVSQSGPTVYFADWLTGLLESGKDALANLLNSDGIWASILIDGVIGGVIAVIGFLPLVMVMYFLIALLEDCGYMARASVVLDPIFKKVGLSGKSIIPFVIGTGCAVPGVMACRTIKSERERRATAMLAPFMPCGAKLPVIALFSRVFFGNSPLIGASMYFVGILIIFLCALLIKVITGSKAKKSFFIMELPEYKIPSIKRAFFSMCQRGWAYVVKAGTIILVCNFIIHLMQNFTWQFTPVVEGHEQYSILATISTPFAYLFAPLIGVAVWQLAASAIAGFIAKENVVGTIAVCFGISNLISVDELVVVGGAANIASTLGISKVAGLAFLIFNLFSPPCFAAIGAMNSELKSRKWFWAGIGLQFAVGYSLSFITMFFGSLFTGSLNEYGSVWFIVLGWAIVLGIATYITILTVKNKTKKTQAEVELSFESATEDKKVA